MDITLNNITVEEFNQLFRPELVPPIDPAQVADLKNRILGNTAAVQDNMKKVADAVSAHQE